MGRIELAGHVKFHPVDPPTGLNIAAVLKAGWPFAVSNSLVMLYTRLDIVILGTVVGATAAAAYWVANTILLAAYLIPQAVFGKFLLPKLHRWHRHRRDRFVEVSRLAGAAIAALGIVLAAAVFVLADPLITGIFGDKYSESAYVLSLMSVCIAIRFASTGFGSALTSSSNMQRKVRCQSLVALVNILVGPLLIVQFGLKGAVISKVITELGLLITYHRVVIRQRPELNWFPG